MLWLRHRLSQTEDFLTKFESLKFCLALVAFSLRRIFSNIVSGTEELKIFIEIFHIIYIFVFLFVFNTVFRILNKIIISNCIIIMKILNLYLSYIVFTLNKIVEDNPVFSIFI